MMRRVVLFLEGQHITVEFESDRKIDDATLWSTPDGGFTGSRKWSSSPATFAARDGRSIVQATLPDGTRAWFVNVRSDTLTGSSDFVEPGRP